MWKPRPNAGVVAWLQESLEDELYMSALSLGEIKKGIEKLADGTKKVRLLRDYGTLRSRFASRVLGVTDIVADKWGEITASAERRGKNLHVVDGLIAATAIVHGMAVVTRNVDDYGSAPVPIVDPWT
jgi:predicted nucleic acid-binding protein